MRFSALLLAGVLLVSTAAHGAPGSLVIVGGALSPDNHEIHRAFIDRAPGKSPRFAIIPAASGSPAGSADAFKKALIAHGVAADRIDIIRLAAIDDPDTKGVDESRWTNAADPVEIATVRKAGAIWFSGGDQARISRLMINASGGDTPMLAAIRDRLSAGVVVGGTSAGAAVMGRMMIARGDSLPSLSQPVLRTPPKESDKDGGPLQLSAGLGFLPTGLTDQHFDRQARLGRLARALGELPLAQRIGFGIDENSALVVDLDRGEATAIGAAGVTLIDARRAAFAEKSGRLHAADLSISLLNGGDRINLATLVPSAAPYKRPTKGREYYDHPAMNGGGMAMAGGRTDEMLGTDLVDNKAVASIERVSFGDGGKGVVYRFAKSPQTRGWFGKDSGGTNRFTISAVSFDIRPVDVTISEGR